MKRRLMMFTLLTALCLSLWLPTTVSAASVSVQIVQDGRALSTQGTLKNGTTYIPLRSLCDELGGNTVSWNQQSRSASVSGGVSATFTAGSNVMNCAGGVCTLSGSSYLSSDTLYIPLRGLAAAMNCGIGYNAASRIVTLSSETSSTETFYSSEDLLWLARIIEAESGGESYNGKLAVGNVILNRVSSANFPNSIYAVIFDRQYGVQFTPTVNGAIYNTPSEESRSAAAECLSGKKVVGNCLYFFNPVTATKSEWIKNNCSYYATIGNHAFYTYG